MTSPNTISQKIINLATSITNLITQHSNITGSSQEKGHVQAGGAPQSIGDSLTAGTDNGYYARADHVNTATTQHITDTNSYSNLNISAKRNSKGCIDMTSIERIESFVWGNYAPASFTGYIDLGTHLTYINTQQYGQLNASLIIRNTVLPTLDSSGWSHLNVKNGYYVYVRDDMLDSWKTLCSGYSNKFKPISELPAELQ